MWWIQMRNSYHALHATKSHIILHNFTIRSSLRYFLQGPVRPFGWDLKEVGRECLSGKRRFIPEGSNVVETVWWVLRRSSLTGIYLGRGRFSELSFLVVIWGPRAPVFALYVTPKSCVFWDILIEIRAFPFKWTVFEASCKFLTVSNTFFKTW